MKQAHVYLLPVLVLHGQNPATQVPILEVDPHRPRLPETRIPGVGAGIPVDAQDNVWIIRRAGMAWRQSSNHTYLQGVEHVPGIR